MRGHFETAIEHRGLAPVLFEVEQTDVDVFRKPEVRAGGVELRDGPVRGAVVEDERFDRADIVQVGNAFDRRADACLLIVGGDQDADPGVE